MKVATIPETRVNASSMPDALDAVFGPHMLRKVHGPSTVVGDFVDGHREFTFSVGIGKVPVLIRRIFCGSQLKVSTRQHLHRRTPSHWEVNNSLRLHFVGSELFNMHPVFWLQQHANVIHLGGKVHHSARLPPPLKWVAESFMLKNTKKELMHFATCLRDSGVID